MKSHRTAALSSLVLLGVQLVAASSAEAIPAFARRYRFSCTTCHAPFPRLKPYGDAFAARGFRLEDPSQEPARATYDVGDPLLHLNRDLPLAIRFDGYASYKESATAEYDFELPWTLKLLSGGPITDRISYYVYGIFEDGESVKLEDTYLQFSSLFGAPVDLLAGQFQVCDPLFKRELRLERNDYQILKTRVGLIPTSLTYDRGIMLAWQAPAALDISGQLVNGNGIDTVADGNFDDNRLKNVAGRLAREFGPVRVGVFGYWGKQKGEMTGTSGPRIVDSRLWYLGPDLVITPHPKWQLSLEYLERRDEDPFFEGRTSDLETRGGFGELHFLPQGPDGRWVLSALYNKVKSEDPNARFENASFTVNRLLARNVRALVEAEYDIELERSRATLGFVTAF